MIRVKSNMIINNKHTCYIINCNDDGSIINYNESLNNFIKNPILNIKELIIDDLEELWNKNRTFVTNIYYNKITYIWEISHTISNDKTHQLICFDVTKYHISSTNQIVSYANICNSIPYLICVVSIDNFNISYVNKYWTKLGYNINNIISHSLLDYVHKDDTKILQDSFTKHKSYDINDSFYIKLQKKNDEFISSKWHFIKVKNRQCIMVGVATELFREKVEQYDSNTFQIISKLIHEIKTPLNSIIGFSQLLEISDSPEESKEYTDTINQSCTFLLKLVNDILDFSRMEEGLSPYKFVWCNLYDIINESINMLKPLIKERNIIINYNESQFQKIQIWGEISKIKQVFTNLLSNAVKYNKKYGSIDINYICNKEMSSDNFAPLGQLIIIDTGVGMNKNQLDNLYQPFNRLGREQSIVSGTGLGLYISKKIIDYHSWNIDIKSHINEGTTVTLNNIKYRVKDDIEILQKSIILYVEDNIENCKLMRKIMSRWDNIEFITTPYGRTGINIALHQNPLLVLLDLNLPDISGANVLKELKKQKPDLPIYVVSADNTKQTMKYIKSLGCNDYITKPIFVEEVIQLIKKYI